MIGHTPSSKLPDVPAAHGTATAAAPTSHLPKPDADQGNATASLPHCNAAPHAHAPVHAPAPAAAADARAAVTVRPQPAKPHGASSSQGGADVPASRLGWLTAWPPPKPADLIAPDTKPALTSNGLLAGSAMPQLAEQPSAGHQAPALPPMMAFSGPNKVDDCAVSDVAGADAAVAEDVSSAGAG